ncbi:hypothetical protein R3W88_022615 [Solanum pinnatisectum]|uniref:Zinc finger GRF-type domain-containing protein n=1 Tax=Solanum pinnatisectum TaxID=50273 RepID=A0AAV9LZ25_9SOLN|nr:hypothetical protein R3W88_022615 [Solanum pinnatisectum]
MSQNSYSSQRKCDCGLVVKTLISSTTSNPGRRFFKCLCPDKWEDQAFFEITYLRHLKLSLKDVKIEMENLKIEIENLKIVMENLKIEGGHLSEKISKLEETNDLDVEEVRTFEDKYYKTKYKFMISCFLFVGFVDALITK